MCDDLGSSWNKSWIVRFYRTALNVLCIKIILSIALSIYSFFSCNPRSLPPTCMCPALFASESDLRVCHQTPSLPQQQPILKLPIVFAVFPDQTTMAELPLSLTAHSWKAWTIALLTTIARCSSQQADTETLAAHGVLSQLHSVWVRIHHCTNLLCNQTPVCKQVLIYLFSYRYQADLFNICLNNHQLLFHISDYLCKPEDNIYNIDFTRFKIRDLETGTVLFEIAKPPVSGKW